MKLRATLATVVAALVAAAAATAAPPPNKGKTPKCKSNVSVIVTGTLAADGAAAPSSLSVTVTAGNKFGKAYAKATQPTGVAMIATTKVVKGGAKATADTLKSGDKVNVQAKACKATLANATPALTATRVTVQTPGA